MASQASRSLFERDLPAGFQYRENFITDADERLLLGAIRGVPFTEFEMRGVVARRRVAFFGQSYDRAAAALITHRRSSSRMSTVTART